VWIEVDEQVKNNGFLLKVNREFLLQLEFYLGNILRRIRFYRKEGQAG